MSNKNDPNEMQPVDPTRRGFDQTLDLESCIPEPPSVTKTLRGDEPTAEMKPPGLECDTLSLADSKEVDRQSGQGILIATIKKELSKPYIEVPKEQIGEYRLMFELGRGGMGVVYKALHQRLKRYVAIKMIHGGAGSRPDVKSRFEAEARAVAALQHPNVVQLFEFGEHQGSPYFALEYVEGGTLTDRLGTTPLSPKEAAELVATVARTMQFAHERQILHRDLKPSNILITQNGIPKISDFGLAKQMLDSDQETRTGTVMGTPSYMSPEQARGATNELAPATDQYSIGAILYTCLSGRPPFMSSSTIDTISQVVNKEPLPLRQLSSSIPMDLETICLKTLQKDPSKRYASCNELADDLERYLRGEPILARPVSRMEKGYRWVKRNPMIATFAGVAISSVTAVAIISSFAWSQSAAQAIVIADERDKAKAQEAEAKRQKIIAEEQKVIAEENEKNATKQALLALSNIQFVLTDVDPKLAKMPGMGDLRIEILQTLTKKWDDLDIGLTGGLRGQAMPTLLDARYRAASALLTLNRPREAAIQFEKLVDAGRDRITVKGRNVDSLLNLAKILSKYAAALQLEEGNSKEAQESLEEAKGLCKEVIQNLLNDVDIAKKIDAHATLASVCQNRATQRLRVGRLLESEQYFQEALLENRTALELANSDIPSNEWKESVRQAYRKDLASQVVRSEEGIANVELRMGNREKGMERMNKLLQAKRELAEANPQTTSLQLDLALGLNLLGKSLIWIRHLEGVEPLLNESYKMFQKMHAEDPKEVKFKRGLAEVCYQMGTLRALQNRTEDSIRFFERARSYWSELYAESDAQRNAVGMMLAEARMGNIKPAVELIEELGEKVETDGEVHLERARAMSQLSRNSNEHSLKSTFRAGGIEALSRSIREGYVDPFRIRSEPDLEPLMDDPRVQSMIAQLEQENRKSLEKK